MSNWESVFVQSRANDGYYSDVELPQKPWQWPAHTWFRERLEQVREREATVFLRSLRKISRKGAPELN